MAALIDAELEPREQSLSKVTRLVRRLISNGVPRLACANGLEHRTNCNEMKTNYLEMSG